VYFNQKEDGKYRYVREPAIMDSEFASEYLQACDLLFDTYSSLIEPMTQQVQKEFPNDASASQRAYASAVRAKVCDVLRCLLPASTMTNTGIYGNGRAFEYLLLKMYSSQLGEIRQAAQSAHQQLGLMIPSFVKRANDAYGLSTQAYLKATCQSVSKQVEEHGLKLYDNQESRQDVQLVHFSDDAENKVVAAILFEHSDRSLSELYAMAKSLSQGQKESIISAYAGSRGNRRHKPGRAFEHCHYAFSLCGNFGMYRDLHRHRLMTQTRQPLSVYHGFELPPELVQAGFGKQVMEAVNFSSSVYKKIAAKMPLEAQYVVPMGFRLRWNINLNLREAYHLIELRSMPQGHIDYRRMVQNMFLEIKKVHPAFAAGMKFVDMSGAKLERLEAEKNIDKRIEEINKKYGTR
ncbi:thymidylate synthase, partial [Candidatus Parvarchaeota archaeon]|nr:thymidylate synthase [Candidatus Parvarchaeota archaeon]